MVDFYERPENFPEMAQFIPAYSMESWPCFPMEDGFCLVLSEMMSSHIDIKDGSCATLMYVAGDVAAAIELYVEATDHEAVSSLLANLY